MKRIILILILIVGFEQAYAELLVGFWGNAAEGAGSGDYIQETSAFASNIVMIKETDPAKIVAKVAKAKSFGKKSVIVLQSLLFPWGHVLPYETYMSPQINPYKYTYAQRFDALWSMLGANQNQVAAFYLFDEPFKHNIFNGMPDKNGNIPGKTYYHQFVRDGLNQVSSYIKSKTSIPTMVLYSPDLEMPNLQSLMLDKVDYLGFDCYLDFNTRENEMCSESAILAMTQKLKTMKNPNQKLFFLLDGYRRRANAANVSDLALNLRNRFWSRVIGENLSETAAVFTFIYQNVPSEDLEGLESPSLSLARESAGVYMAGYSGQVYCLGNDLFGLNGTRWPNAPYCAARCEGKNLVRRRITGEMNGLPWVNAPMCQ